MLSVTWRELYDSGAFANEDEARGALKLAVRQAIQPDAKVTIGVCTGLSLFEVGEWLMDDRWLPESRGVPCPARRPYLAGEGRQR